MSLGFVVTNLDYNVFTISGKGGERGDNKGKAPMGEGSSGVEYIPNVQVMTHNEGLVPPRFEGTKTMKRTFYQPDYN